MQKITHVPELFKLSNVKMPGKVLYFGLTWQF